MGIRNAAKAIVLHEGKILLNRCRTPDLGDYCGLPGGGQNQYETMEEAVIRECLEETGYAVVPDAFVALFEEISASEARRKAYPDYAHKIFHVFRCHLRDVIPTAPSEEDPEQLGCQWVSLDDLPSTRILPACIHERIRELIETQTPLYLGTQYD